MAIATTPHTESEQNLDSAEMDLEPNLTRQDVGQSNDAELYSNAEGAQTGGTRSFHANATRSTLPKVEGETAAMDGGTTTRLPEGDEQGITNHSMSEESVGQRKVISERPDAQQGVDQVGKSVR